MTHRYDAFISYSHAADGALAPALQSALHRLARPWFRLRALRVFRDQTSLAASPELWPAIEAALQGSRHFLLLASPAAAASKWVQREITWWLEHRSADSLFVLVSEGALVWDEEIGDFDWPMTDCLPREVLAGRWRSEPLWVDLRWARDAQVLGLRHARFRQAVLDVAAPLHGIDKDQLDGDDVRRMTRVRQLVAVTGAALLALALAATAAFLDARRQREEAERRGLVAEARRLAAEADLLRSRGTDPDLAILTAAEGLRRLAAAKAADMAVDLSLRRALAAAPIEITRPAGQVTLNEAGEWVERPSPSKPQALAAGDCRPQLYPVASSTSDGRRCVVVERADDATVRRIAVFEARAGEAPTSTWEVPLGPKSRTGIRWSVSISPDGRWLLMALDEDPGDPAVRRPARPAKLQVWQVDGGRLVHEETDARVFGFLPGQHHLATTSGVWSLPATPGEKTRRLWEWLQVPRSIAFSRNGKFVGTRVSSDDEVSVWSLEAQQPHLASIAAGPGKVMAIANDGKALVVGRDKTLWVIGAGGTERVDLPDVALQALFTPQGLRILVSDKRAARLLQLPNGSAWRELWLDPGVLPSTVVTDARGVDLFLRWDEEVNRSGVITTRTHLRLDRWEFDGEGPRTVFRLPAMTSLFVSTDGRRWAATAGMRDRLWLGLTDLSAPPLEVPGSDKTLWPWINPSGWNVSRDEEGNVLVRNPIGQLQWLLPPSKHEALGVSLTADDQRVLLVRQTDDGRGTGLDATTRFELQHWPWQHAPVEPERRDDLGQQDRLPDSMCFLSGNGRQARWGGRWQTLAASAPPGQADMRDEAGCAEAAPHGLRFIHRDTGEVDVVKDGVIRHRLESSLASNQVVASADGEIAVVVEDFKRLRVYPLTPERLLAQACQRTLRPLSTDEAERLMDPGAGNDPCGRAVAPAATAASAPVGRGKPR